MKFKEKSGFQVKPATGISLDELTAKWEVWYKGVQFAALDDLKAAHDRLQKLLALDTLE